MYSGLWNMLCVSCSRLSLLMLIYIYIYVESGSLAENEFYFPIKTYQAGRLRSHTDDCDTVE
jgi:hypothetical protein